MDPPPPHSGQESAEAVEKKEEMKILHTESTESTEGREEESAHPRGICNLLKLKELVK